MLAGYEPLGTSCGTRQRKELIGKGGSYLNGKPGIFSGPFKAHQGHGGDDDDEERRAKLPAVIASLTPDKIATILTSKCTKNNHRDPKLTNESTNLEKYPEKFVVNVFPTFKRDPPYYCSTYILSFI